MSSHLARSSSFSDMGAQADPYTPAMLLELYRLARNQGNVKHSHKLIQRQIMELTGEMDSPMDALNSSTEISDVEKLRVMRELAKLYACRGQTASAIDLLTNSIVNYCQSRPGARATGPLGSGAELAARSLLVIVKWMQSDTRLMQAVWSSEYDISQRMSVLLKAEFDCRKMRLGLYGSAEIQESYELFQPDESVARFDKHEYSMGQLLHLSTMYCPELAKGWWSLAGWCYRIGRKNLEALRYVSVSLCISMYLSVSLCISMYCISLYLFLYLSLPLFLPFSLSPSSLFYLSPSLSFSLSLSPSLSPSLSFSLSLSPSLSFSLSLSPSVSPSLCFSLSLSPSLFLPLFPSLFLPLSLSPSLSPSLFPFLPLSLSPSFSLSPLMMQSLLAIV